MRLAVVLILAACTTSQPGATQSAPPAGPPPPPAEPEVGAWHQPAKVDATNLEIASDGTFAWDINGCDFFGGDQGRWHHDASGGLVLEPNATEKNFRWMDEVGLATVTSLHVTRNGDVLAITGHRDGKALSQTWESGSVCAVCGNQLGPTGLKKCDHKVRKH